MLLAVLLGAVACASGADREATPPLGDDDTSSASGLDASGYQADTPSGMPDTLAEPGLDTVAPGYDTAGPETIHPGDDGIEPPPDTIHEDTTPPDKDVVIIPGCCGSDAPCPDGLVCAGGIDGAGVCLEHVPGPGCWVDEECDSSQECLGALVCPCDADCDSPDSPGLCAPSGFGCCLTEWDCPDGYGCYPDSWPTEFGVCKLHAPEGMCWGSADCAEDELCAGATFCGCGFDCAMAETPGTCVPQVYDGCCETQEDCPTGLSCAFVWGGDEPGICKAPAPLGACWDDADCGDYGTCVGASTCPCGVICGMDETFGTCEPLYDGCCAIDDDCATGTVCAVHPGQVIGACHPDPAGLECSEGGCCWTDDDCTSSEFCKGAGFCGCSGPLDGDCDQSVMGSCVPWWPLCCQDDGDCPLTYDCITNDYGDGVCKEPPAEGTCWEDADCGSGEACLGVGICPCDAMCDMMDMPGTCTSLYTGCCTSDDDCASGTVCEGGSLLDLPGSCVPDPTGPACLGDAACCWTDDDCPSDSFCEGASTCGCVEMCPTCGACMPDTMGTCKATFAFSCCVEGTKCGAGLECVATTAWETGTCLPTPPPGRCWTSDDCSTSETCIAPSYCPCDVDCDMSWDSPGVCAPPGATCADMTGVDFGGCDAELGWVLQGTTCVTVSGCSPGQFGLFVFDTKSACESACNLYL